MCWWFIRRGVGLQSLLDCRITECQLYRQKVICILMVISNFLFLRSCLSFLVYTKYISFSFWISLMPIVNSIVMSYLQYNLHPFIKNSFILFCRGWNRGPPGPPTKDSSSAPRIWQWLTRANLRTSVLSTLNECIKLYY